ncbi:hypothetical protein BCM02_109238 [Paenibacillus methanolicus]|uniref:Uncharacterized protein n=1 Tax=Paenibacillus methanolicus TaxID=582686 RepID=A0A5S5BYE1_9BACL|nr:hypothetical protein BCM02_109238 [Paenibacillus methanolicus]
MSGLYKKDCRTIRFYVKIKLVNIDCGYLIQLEEPVA